MYDVADSGPQSAVVAVESALAGRSVAMVLPNVSTANVTVSQLEFSLSEDDAAFRLGVSATGERPDDVPALSSAEPVGFVRVRSADVNETAFASGTFRLDVSRQSVRALDASPEAVTVYRYHDGSWQPLDTRYTGSSYVVQSPGFSVFAVGVQQSDAPTATPTPTPTPTPDATTAATETPAPTPTTTTTSPGFGALVALLALLSVALLARSHTRR